MLPCIPPPQGPSLDPNETVFTRTVRDYVFMCFAPSFLRSPGGAVTRISESKRSRRIACAMSASVDHGLSIRGSDTKASRNVHSALPAQGRVHGGPKTPPEARRGSRIAHSIDCCVRSRIQTDRAPESLVRHVPSQVALDAERCRQSIRKVDCGPTRCG